MYVCVLRWGRSLAWLARMLGRLCCTVIHKCIDVFLMNGFCCGAVTVVSTFSRLSHEMHYLNHSVVRVFLIDRHGFKITGYLQTRTAPITSCVLCPSRINTGP